MLFFHHLVGEGGGPVDSCPAGSLMRAVGQELIEAWAHAWPEFLTLCLSEKNVQDPCA